MVTTQPTRIVPVPSRPGQAAQATAAATETGMENFMQLFNSELAGPLAKIAVLADNIEELRAAGFQNATLTTAKDFAELAETASRTARTASRLIQLSKVLTGAAIIGDERILLIDVLKTAAQQFADPARQRRVGIQLDDGRQSLAPIYGSAYWLGMAFDYLLARMAIAAPPGTHILIRLRQMGCHQFVVANINHGRPAANTQDLLPPARSSVKTSIANLNHADQLDVALARAIIEQHGGTLKTDELAGEKLNEFHLSLPTGESPALRARANCENCPYLRQAEQFAQDIGELLGQRSLGTS